MIQRNDSIDFYRLSELGNKVKAGLATTSEKDEFMFLMFKAKKISQQQYEMFKSNIDADALMNAALAVGAVLLLGQLLNELFSKK